MKVYFRIVLVSTLFLLSVFSSFAQITVNTTNTPTQLVNGVLIPSGSGTTVSNVVFRGVYNNGGNSQVGSFSTATTTLAQMGFSDGIVLATGNVQTIPLTLGANPGATQWTDGYSSCVTGEIRETGTCPTTNPAIVNDLNILAGTTNFYNAAILEFDFIPVENSVSFRYIFGSDEYNDSSNSAFDTNYNCSRVNDKFGFLISGPGIIGGQGFDNNARNIARLANGSEVSINSVNDGIVGSSYTQQGASYCQAANTSWVQNTPSPEFLGTIDGTELNGNTKILTAIQTGLTPGATYHIKLIITELEFANYDSVVYLEAGSFTTESTCNAGPDQSLCATTSATLAAVSPATGSWSVVSGSGTFVSNTNPNTTVNGLSIGANVFRWTASDLSCTSDVTVTVGSTPNAGSNGTLTVCQGTTPTNAQLFAALGGTPTSGGSWTNVGLVYTYTVNATAPCTTPATATVTVTQQANVIPTFTQVLPICSGATLDDLPIISTNGITGTWSPALNNTAITIYTFTPTAGQCATLTTMTIIVNETPVVTISEGCNGVVYELSAIVSSGVATYEWFNSSSVSLGTTPTISITSTGTYEVRVSLNGCTVSDFVTVDNAFCMIPKGISPNNDGDNDSWDLSNLNVETAQIFNRYGVEVYSKNNYTDEWDGRTDSGEELPTATYYYVLTFPNGVVKTGWVYLNRVN